ncbi:MAG: hypothetical protein WEA79_02630 [Balneolaceae bacterium]
MAFSCLMLNTNPAQAQDKNYTFTPAPDVWYNSVDGVRLGLRVLGEVEGTFKDGPHRLDAGIWLGTKFPELPVSYYLSFTEPIAAISSFGNEGNVQLISSIRTGYNEQKIALNKRWQAGFDETRYKELSLSFSQEKLIDYEYRPYNQLWQNDWKSLVGADFVLSDFTATGKFDANVILLQNLNTTSETFTVITLELKQQIELNQNFGIKLRVFGGFGSDNTAPEHLFGKSYRQPAKWLQNGFSRAKGTLPKNWLNDGLFHIAGGANLRGYTFQDFESLSNGGAILYTQTAAVNAEFEFPNPINHLFKSSVIGDFVHLSSYTFFDTGFFYRDSIQQTPDLVTDLQEFVSDAGIGFQFSLNIPDVLGKDRGFAVRYEIPFWLSDSGDESNFKFRSLIGIGAVISL